ncbi:hypothetical protein ABIB37_000350 [Agrococcus sp. UYP10]|uniref:hypothetical protein n=1 Tax=Agrococcus sp. UYP10 TaxID=1756355 RepID=UPI00339B2A64
MPSEGTRPWAYAGLGAAALFAVGSVVAVTIVGDQRRADAEAASGSSSQLQERYATAASAIDAWEAEQLQAQCEADARIVGSVQLEQRMEAALGGAAIVEDAYIIIEAVDRAAFEESRAAAVEVFAAGFTTDDDAAVAAEYEGVADPLAACLAEAPPTTEPAPAGLTADDVEALESRAAALDDAAPDTARLDQLDQTVTAFGPAVLQAADARVAVNGLGATADALGAATEPLRAQTAPAQTIDALEALTAHAQVALDLQAAIAAEQAAVEAPVEQAPAPAPRPVQPAPAPAPAPPPAPSEPTPTDPGDGGEGGNGGDAPTLPEVP